MYDTFQSLHTLRSSPEEHALIKCCMTSLSPFSEVEEGLKLGWPEGDRLQGLVA